MNTCCILILVIGIIYLSNFRKVEGRSNINMFYINVICMENVESNKVTTEVNEEAILFTTWCLPLSSSPGTLAAAETQSCH